MLIGVVTSDKRQESIAETLEQRGYTVIKVVKSEDLCFDMDILVLPIRGINESCIMKLQNTVLNFNEFFKNAKKELVIYSGVNCQFLEKLPFHVIHLLSDEDIINYNAKLTAQGLLIDLLLNIHSSIDEIAIDIIGYGHCGKAIYKLLSSINPNVRVISRRNLSEYENSPVNTLMFEEYLQQEEYADVLINTVPAMMINEKIISKLDKNTLLLDIATAPGGIDFDCATKYHLQALLLPALPSKYVWKSAGRILGERIIKDVEQDE